MRRHLFSQILSLSFLISLIFLNACENKNSQIQRPLPLEQDTFIQVYFNNNQAQGADYTEPYRQITRPGDNLEQIIIDAINSAQSTIDVAVQELRSPKIAQALANKYQEGIKIRVILENIYNRPFSEFKQQEIEQLDERESSRYKEFIALVDTNQDGQLSSQEINEGDALVILKNADIPLIDDTADGSKGSGLMHHKFVVVDNHLLITGSTNFTTSGIHGDFLTKESRGNANNLLRINNTPLANLFTQEFNIMWGDGPGNKLDSQFGKNKPLRKPQQVKIGTTNITVQFSPTSPTKPWDISSNGLIGRNLENAKKSIDLALFVFSEQKIANTLEKNHQQTVTIRTLIDPGFAFNYYSEGLDMLGVALSNKCKYEVDNSPWQTPITTVGVPQLPKGDKLHHKFGVIDKQIVITGSHNWSTSANYNNDETVLVINNPIVAAHFIQEFERLYSKAVLGVPIVIQRKIQAEKESCPQITTSLSDPILISIININTASKAELESLPGIGEVIAQRIIETRKKKPFTSLEDLTRVPGIGAKMVKKLDGRVTW